MQGKLEINPYDELETIYSPMPMYQPKECQMLEMKINGANDRGETQEAHRIGRTTARGRN